MALDFIAGNGSQLRNPAHHVGSIGHHELPAILRLLAQADSFFLHRIFGLYEDQTFSAQEVEQALAHLVPLLASPLESDDRTLLHKLIAVLAYAKVTQQPLHGVALTK